MSCYQVLVDIEKKEKMWAIKLSDPTVAEFNERIASLWPNGSRGHKSVSVERIMRWFFSQPVEWQKALVHDRLAEHERDAASLADDVEDVAESASSAVPAPTKRPKTPQKRRRRHA